MADTDLIESLDPQRDYGDRSFEQVVEGVRSGALYLEPGATLPVIKDTSTNLVVKGTGRPPNRGAHAAFSRGYIQEQFANNAEDIWNAIMAGIRDGDPRWAKLALEYGIGAPLQDKGNEGLAADAVKLLTILAQRQVATSDPADYVDAQVREV